MERHCHDYGCGSGAEGGVEPDFTWPARDVEPDIGVLERIDAQRFVQRVADLFERQGKIEGYGIRRALQAGKMFFEQKEHAAVSAHGFIDAVAVKKAVV